jgi:hypothetical protein
MHCQTKPSRILSTLRRVALAGVFGLLACQANEPLPMAPPDDPDAAVLRTYKVPPEQVRSLENALKSALWTGKDLPPRGTVERLPDGQLLVVAPAGIHEGIAALVGGLASSATPPTHTVAFDYWVVVGEAAAEAGGLDIPDVGPALAAIVREQGPMRFTLIEKVQMASLLDETAKVKGDRTEVRQVVTEVGGRLVADLEIITDQGQHAAGEPFCFGGSCKDFRTRVHVSPGQLLVIGQTGLARPADGAARSVFYVVRGRTMAEGG